ncbi:MAG: hypothetical protein IT379_11800 [Deltaproteobacteria bacterium]|nr:hypothetical protein [Deltaproteobacteria bacterium]
MAESNYARQGEFVRACLFGPERTAIMARQTAALAEKTHRLVAELYEAILGKTALTIPDQRAVRQLVSPATRDELDTPPPAVPPRRRIEWPPRDTT